MNHSAPAPAAIAKAMEDSLADLQSEGLTGDEPWGEILSTQGAHGRIRLHGGSSDAGVLNSLGGDALGRQGYASIVSGSAYLQLVRWEGGRVRANVVLAHGQSLDPASPHHTDQLEIFAGKKLVPMPFYESDIQRDAALKTLRLH